MHNFFVNFKIKYDTTWIAVYKCYLSSLIQI